MTKYAENPFWTCKNNWRISMSGGDQFLLTIRAGLDGETLLSVGYSSPNSAEVIPEMVDEFSEFLNEYWDDNIKELELMEMMPQMFKVCEYANGVYNKLLDKYWHLFQEKTE